MTRAGIVMLVLMSGSLLAAQDAEQSRILALEVAWNHAVQQRDGQAVDALLGTELIYVEYDGTVMDKTHYMESIRTSPLPAEQVVSESMRVQVYGKSAIVIGVYREKGKKGGRCICTGSGLWTCG